MPIRFACFIAFTALLQAPAFAQPACTARATPDLAAELPEQVLFSHCMAEGKCGAIDKTGAWKVPPVHRDLMIEGDFIVVPENDDWSAYGFLDSDGTRLGGGAYSISIEEQIPVSEGLMPVIVGEKMGYADRTGTLVIPAEFDEAFAFQGGLAAVSVGGRRAFIDPKGETVLTVPEGMDDVYAFDGDVAVAGKGGVYGLIGRDGQFVLAPKFSSLYFDHGVLIALDGERMGIVNEAGEWVSEESFETVGAFSNGLAPAQHNGKWGFIDSCGNWTIEPKFDQAIGFDGGPARVKIGEKWGLIGRDGAEIYAPQAAFIGDGVWTDGLITFTLDDEKFGLLDTSGKVVVEPQYTSIEPIGGGVVLAYSGEDEKLLDLAGNEIPIAPAP